MLERARHNAAEAGFKNVSFERADIEHLPLADGTANAAISNCVINLTPDKAAVYREIFRVLKSGGRLSVSDIVLRGSADAVRAFRAQSTPDTWCACISGALEEHEYLGTIRAAGFADVRVVSERAAQFQPGSAVQAVAVTINARKPV
jgi:ubiquinone/menaquinone biosynthesis C-methylase UbiE